LKFQTQVLKFQTQVLKFQTQVLKFQTQVLKFQTQVCGRGKRVRDPVYAQALNQPASSSFFV
jgi:hypothetical protein